MLRHYDRFQHQLLEEDIHHCSQTFLSIISQRNNKNPDPAELQTAKLGNFILTGIPDNNKCNKNHFEICLHCQG